MTVTYFGNLEADQLTRTHEAADHLLSLPVSLDFELRIKLDTFHADLLAAIEDSAPAVLTCERAQ